MNDISNTATENETETATKHYQCRHIFTDGHRCASPCLRHEDFCYYHHTTRKPVANPQKRRSRRTTFHLPLPEDRSAILQSIGEVLQRIAANDIDPRRAGLLLYGLQIANTVLPKEPKEPATASRRYTRSSHDESPITPQTVEEITHDPTHGILAPRAEITTPASRPSFAQQLIQHLQSCPPEPHNRPQYKTWEDPNLPAQTEPPTEPAQPNKEPEILPTIQATSVSTTHSTTPRKINVISTGGGAFDAAVERPLYFAFALAVACSPHPHKQSAESCILKKHAQTNSSNHSGRLGLPSRDPRKRHRSRPQTHLRQAPPRIPQHPYPRQRALRRPARRPDGQL
jgi:hypothetical protein